MSIEQNINMLNEEIRHTAESCGRDASEITLVAVTKYSENDDILKAYEQGLKNFGENRVQLALPKIEELPNDINWHLIGHLQKNKVKYVLGKFVLIHSVESISLAKEISKRAGNMGICQDVLIEANMSGEISKFGVDYEGAFSLIEEMMDLPNINIRGLMTMAPFVADETVIGNCFSKLRKLRDELEEKFGLTMPDLSMGMTNDYKIAIKEGATIIRVGSAIFK